MRIHAQNSTPTSITNCSASITRITIPGVGSGGGELGGGWAGTRFGVGKLYSGWHPSLPHIVAPGNDVFEPGRKNSGDEGGAGSDWDCGGDIGVRGVGGGKGSVGGGDGGM